MFDPRFSRYAVAPITTAAFLFGGAATGLATQAAASTNDPSLSPGISYAINGGLPIDGGAILPASGDLITLIGDTPETSSQSDEEGITKRRNPLGVIKDELDKKHPLNEMKDKRNPVGVIKDELDKKHPLNHLKGKRNLAGKVKDKLGRNALGKISDGLGKSKSRNR